MDQRLQKECHVPSDAPALSGETKKTPVNPFKLDSADGIPREAEITKKMSLVPNGGVNIQSTSPITHVTSSDSVDGIPREDEFSITNSSNGGLDIRSHSPVMHSPHYPREIPRSCVTTLTQANAGSSTTGKDRFFADSGANLHATGNRNLFSRRLTADKAGFPVKMANGYVVRSHGCGCVITEDYTIPDVHYVPGLDTNVVSVSELNDLDYSVAFTRNNGCSIMDARTDTNNLLVGKGIRGISGLFELDFLRIPLDRTRSETKKK